MKVIIVHPHKCTTHRTWRERLFTLPWRPFTAVTEELVNTLKPGQVVKHSNTLYMDAATHAEFVKAFEKTRKLICSNEF